MLEFLRQKAQSTFIQVIIVVIILVFVFWGVGSQQGSGVNSAATVNDEPITYAEFQRSYDERINQLRDQLGGNIPDGLLQTLGVKDQVLNGLIQRALISQGAFETGLMVGDADWLFPRRVTRRTIGDGRFSNFAKTDFCVRGPIVADKHRLNRRQGLGSGNHIGNFHVNFTVQSGQHLRNITEAFLRILGQ